MTVASKAGLDLKWDTGNREQDRGTEKGWKQFSANSIQ